MIKVAVWCEFYHPAPPPSAWIGDEEDPSGTLARVTRRVAASSGLKCDNEMAAEAFQVTDPHTHSLTGAGHRSTALGSAIQRGEAHQHNLQLIPYARPKLSSQVSTEVCLPHANCDIPDLYQKHPDSRWITNTLTTHDLPGLDERLSTSAHLLRLSGR